MTLPDGLEVRMSRASDAAWVGSCWARSEPARGQRAFMACQWWAWAAQATGRTAVVCSVDDPDVLHAFATVAGGVVQYAYVAHPLRGLGLATACLGALLPGHVRFACALPPPARVRGDARPSERFRVVRPGGEGAA